MAIDMKPSFLMTDPCVVATCNTAMGYNHRGVASATTGAPANPDVMETMLIGRLDVDCARPEVLFPRG
jgi:hypothetical protein